jgi:DNA polymerase-3 subunit beta
MRVSCLQENLAKGLGVVGRAVASRTTLPITQNVLISTDQGRIKLAATNLEIAITTWIGANVEEEGSISVPARLLSEFVNSLPSGTIDIVGSDSPKSIQLKCATFDARINGTDAEEFPPIPSVTGGLGFTAPSKLLKAALDRTVFAAATEESRPVLTGIKIEIESDKITLAAADGFRLAVYSGEIETSVKEPIGVIIPSRSLNELNRFLSDKEQPVEIMFSDNNAQVMFKTEDLELVSQLIQGNFPPFAELLADATKDTQCKSEFKLTDFLAASKVASIFARDSSGIIRLEIKPVEGEDVGQLTISAKAEEIGENTSQIDGKVQGQGSKIAFNSKYLLDVLGSIGTEKVILETSGPSRAGVFRPTDSENYVHLVMPMFVQW